MQIKITDENSIINQLKKYHIVFESHEQLNEWLSQLNKQQIRNLFKSKY